MTTAENLIAELKLEGATTKRLLDRIPDTKLTWKPHEKSMTLGRLALHITELQNFIARIVQTEEFNIGDGPYMPKMPSSQALLLEEFEKTVSNAIQALTGVNDDLLAVPWKFRKGEIVIANQPRGIMIRQQINHIVHHRGQLSVYLRLLDIPLPHIYGPSADER